MGNENVKRATRWIANLGAQVWTAWAAAFIALASSAVSIVTASTLIEQGAVTREHYMRKMTPLVLPDVTTNPVDETWGIS